MESRTKSWNSGITASQPQRLRQPLAASVEEPKGKKFISTKNTQNDAQRGQSPPEEEKDCGEAPAEAAPILPRSSGRFLGFLGGLALSHGALCLGQLQNSTPIGFLLSNFLAPQHGGAVDISLVGSAQF